MRFLDIVQQRATATYANGEVRTFPMRYGLDGWYADISHRWHLKYADRVVLEDGTVIRRYLYPVPGWKELTRGSR